MKGKHKQIKDLDSVEIRIQTIANEHWFHVLPEGKSLLLASVVREDEDYYDQLLKLCSVFYELGAQGVKVNTQVVEKIYRDFPEG